MSQSLSAADQLARLRLLRSENIGPVTFQNLLTHYGNAETALDALPELARRGGRASRFVVYARAKAEAEIAALTQLGAQMVFWGAPEYPKPLAVLKDAPPMLTCLGHMHLLHKPCIAFVGARNASAAALKLTEQMAAEIGAAGYVIVSGMARGIDAQAHHTSLATGTIAALAGGIDNIYPEEHADLYARLSAEGAILSESPFGTKPLARHFPRRNRIIAGLALGVVVVEASLRSGSLITARLGNEYGREVMAVPGSPLDARSTGSNYLIQTGAALVQTADDILNVIRNLPTQLAEPTYPPKSDGPPPTPPSESERKQVLALLSTTPISLDDLVQISKLPLPKVMLIVLELEIAGRIMRNPNQDICLMP